MEIGIEVIGFVIKLALTKTHRHSELPKPCSERGDTKESTQTLYHAEDLYRYLRINKSVFTQQFLR